jgi:hypothetical protein
MKKSLSLTILFFLSVYVSFSQNIGIEAGLNFNTIHQNVQHQGDKFATNIDIGARAGFFGINEFSELVAIKGGFYFSSKGYAVDVKEETGQSGEYYRMNLNYIELPVSVMFRFGAVNAFIGPYIAYGIFGNTDSSSGGKHKITFKDTLYDSGVGSGSGSSQVISAFDAGLNVGASFAIQENVEVAITFLKGFKNLNPEVSYNSTIISSEDKYTNTVLSSSLILLF